MLSELPQSYSHHRIFDLLVRADPETRSRLHHPDLFEVLCVMKVAVRGPQVLDRFWVHLNRLRQIVRQQTELGPKMRNTDLNHDFLEN